MFAKIYIENLKGNAKGRKNEDQVEEIKNVGK